MPCENMHNAFPRKRPRSATAGQELTAALSEPVPADGVPPGLALYGPEQRMVFGASTYRQFARMLGPGTGESGVGDPWVSRMRSLPATVVSSTLQGPLDWPDATVVSGDAVHVVARLKAESEVPLHSHGSLSLNHALTAVGLVDRVQVTIFGGAADFDLELTESRTLDGNTQELTYWPTLHA